MMGVIEGMMVEDECLEMRRQLQRRVITQLIELER